jgi:hypothetical protein
MDPCLLSARARWRPVQSVMPRRATGVVEEATPRHRETSALTEVGKHHTLNATTELPCSNVRGFLGDERNEAMSKLRREKSVMILVEDFGASELGFKFCSLRLDCDVVVM